MLETTILNKKLKEIDHFEKFQNMKPLGHYVKMRCVLLKKLTVLLVFIFYKIH